MEEKSMIFKDVTFYTVGDIEDEVISLLTGEGGKRDTYLSEMVSHVIADSTSPGEYSEAKDIFERPIVSSDWVRLSVICKKQLPKENFALEGCLFSGVVACPSRLDITDARSLWSMLVYNGGKCQLKFDKNVTHLISSGTDGVKYTEGLLKENVKIVTPDWVTDCIKKEGIQDEAVYHPRLIVYPKPETPPPKPKTPAVRLSEINDLTSMIGQQMAMGGPLPFNRRRKSSSDDSPRNGSRPGTPSAKEALARMVSSRLQASGKSADAAEISATLASMFPPGQFPGMPGVPQGSGMPYGQAPMQGMHFNMGMGQGHSPTRGQSPIQGHPLAHVPHPGQGHQQNQMYMPGAMPHVSQGQMQHQGQPHAQAGQGHMQAGQGQGHMMSGQGQSHMAQTHGQMPPGHGQQMIPGQAPAQMQLSPGQVMQQGQPPMHASQTQVLGQGQAHMQPGQGQGHMHQGQGQPHMQQSQAQMQPGHGQPHMQQGQGHMQQGQVQPHMQQGQSSIQQGQPHLQGQGQVHMQKGSAQAHMLQGQGHGPMQQVQGHMPQSQGHMQPGQGHMPAQHQAQMMSPTQGQLPGYPGPPLHHQGQGHQQQMRYPGQQQMPRSQGQMPGQLPSPTGQMRPQMQGQFPVGPQGHRMPQGHNQGHPQRPPGPPMKPHPQLQGHPQFPGQQRAAPSPVKSPMQGQMAGQMQVGGQMPGQGPPVSLSAMPNAGMAQLPPPETLQPNKNRSLRNITNNTDNSKSKISQMLEMNRPPPPRYPGVSAPPPTAVGAPPLTRPPPPAIPIYYGHDSSENVAPDMCLLGCVFFITDYQTLLGADEIKSWREVIEQHGGEIEDTYCSRVTHVLSSTQHSDFFQLALTDEKRLVTAFWLNDSLIKKKMAPPTQGLHLPLPFSDQKPCKNLIICVTNFDGEERKRVKQLVTSLGAKYTGYMTQANSVLICKKPDGIKYRKAKEWKIPVVNVQWLTDLVCGHLDALRLPINPKYQIPNAPDPFLIDTNLVSRLLVGWRTPLKIPKEAWKKFISKPKPSPDQENQQPAKNQKSDEFEEILAKKPRLEQVNEPAVVLLTGFPSGVTKKLSALAEHLGLKVTQNASQCSHVIMPSLCRTMKLFEAINSCKYVLGRDWLDESLNQGKLLDEEKFLLKDQKAEKEFGCCLVDSIHRAQIKPLFQGMTFYVTPSVVPQGKDITKIINSAGGAVVSRRPSAKNIVNMVDDKGKPTFIVVTCNNDLHLCRDLFAQKINVYNAEFILTSILRQEIDFTLFMITIPTST